VITGDMGSVILFDYQIMHRGGPNNSNEPRPIMYLTWVREWWMDRVNFNTQHTEAFDILSDPEMRKILSRVDAKHYHEKLDDAVLENGIDTSRSKFHYGAHNYERKSQV